MSQIPRPTPFIDYPIAGEKLTYDPLSITFLVDEDLQSWQEIHNWIRGLTFPKDFAEYRKLRTQAINPSAEQPQYSDASIVVLNSNQVGNFRFEFTGCFPTSLGALQLSTTTGPEMTLTADASFAFTLFDIIKI